MKNLVVLLAGILFIASCGKTDSPNKKTTKEIEIEKPWIRSAAAGMNTALFFNLINNTEFDDTLISVESDAAELIQIHETLKDENGMMRMEEIGKVAVAKNDSVIFKPMGKHIMFIVLKNDLMSGDSVLVKFNFTKSNQIVQKILVKDFMRKE
ncbi:MAG: hypothetical protein Fur0015_03500 [Ignavibacteriales bacterium]